MAIIHLHIELDTAYGESLQDICKQIARGIEQAENRPVALAGQAVSVASAARNIYDDIVAFLNSDSRYSQRTAAAIAKGVNLSEAFLADYLDELTDRDVLRTRTRRSDGVTLYSLA